MPVVMRVMGCSVYHLAGMEGWYVHHVDVQAAATSDTWIQLTEDISDAWLWDSPKEALETWKEIIWSDPVRPDGKPNRPMTVFTVSVEELPNETKRRILK